MMDTEALKNLRVAHLMLSQEKFAKLLGTTQATVYLWESGKSVPSADMWYKINQLQKQARAGVHRDDIRLKQDGFSWADYVGDIRLALGRTQAQLANILKTTTTTVSSWECGKTKPSGKFIEKLGKLDEYIKKNHLRNTKAYQQSMKKAT